MPVMSPLREFKYIAKGRSILDFRFWILDFRLGRKRLRGYFLAWLGSEREKFICSLLNPKSKI
jgi:hypothetical protein